MDNLAPFSLYIYTIIALLCTWEGFILLSKYNKINSYLIQFKEKVGTIVTYIIVACFGAGLASGYWWGIQRVFPSQEVLEVPRFSEETSDISISVGNEQHFTTPISALKKKPFVPININGFMPIKVYYLENNIYADVEVYSGSGLPPIQIKKKILRNRPPNWDFNLNEKALEIVNEKQIPMYQYIYKTPSHIIINGVFPLPNDGVLSSGKFSRIFKYPAWKYPGEYEKEERKAEIIKQLNQFVRNGNVLLLQIGNAHSSQFPSKYPLPKNMKPFPIELKIAEWSKDVYNYLIVDVPAWAEYYHKLSTRDIVVNFKPYMSPQEKYRTSMIALMEEHIDRILEIIKHVNNPNN